VFKNHLLGNKQKIIWCWILENALTQNNKASWNKQEKKGHEHVTSDPRTDFTVDEIIKAFKQTHNWKSPRLDKLQDCYIKPFSVMHEDLTRAINEMIKSPKNIPLW
jgi:hypothetical protein